MKLHSSKLVLGLVVLMGCATYRKHEKAGDELLANGSYSTDGNVAMACSEYLSAYSRVGSDPTDQQRVQEKYATNCYKRDLRDMQDKLRAWKADKGEIYFDTPREYLLFRAQTDNPRAYKPYVDAYSGTTGPELAALDSYFLDKLNLASEVAREKARKSYITYYGDMHHACAQGDSWGKQAPEPLRSKYAAHCKLVGDEMRSILTERIADRNTRPMARAVFTQLAALLNIPGYTEAKINEARDQANAAYRRKILITVQNGHLCSEIAGKISSISRMRTGLGAPIPVTLNLSECSEQSKVLHMNTAQSEKKFRTVKVKRWVDEDIIVGYRSAQTCSPAFSQTYYGTAKDGVQTNTTFATSSCRTSSVPIYQHFRGEREFEEQQEIKEFYAVQFVHNGKGTVKYDGKSHSLDHGGVYCHERSKESAANCRTGYASSVVHAVSELVDNDLWSAAYAKLSNEARTSRSALEEYAAFKLIRNHRDVDAIDEEGHIRRCAIGVTTDRGKSIPASSCGAFTLAKMPE